MLGVDDADRVGTLRAFFVRSVVFICPNDPPKPGFDQARHRDTAAVTDLPDIAEEAVLDPQMESLTLELGGRT